jgi:hypothetical protein
MMEFNLHPDSRQLRSFSAALITLSIILGVVVYRRSGLSLRGECILAAVAAIGMFSVFGLFWPWLIRPMYQVWHVITFPVGWFVSHLLLGVIFFLLITPLAVLLRLLGKDAMQRKFDRNASSYWETKVGERKGSDYFRQF